MIDEMDRRILDILQSSGRTSNAEIARQVGMAPSAVLERIRRLEERGVIRGYGAQLDPRKLGRPLLAYVLVRCDERTGSISTGHALALEPEVLEVHHVAGQDSYLCKVRVADPEALGRLLRERFGAIQTVRSTQTTIALETLKEGWSLPVAAPEAKAVARG